MLIEIPFDGPSNVIIESKGEKEDIEHESEENRGVGIDKVRERNNEDY